MSFLTYFWAPVCIIYQLTLLLREGNAFDRTVASVALRTPLCYCSYTCTRRHTGVLTNTDTVALLLSLKLCTMSSSRSLLILQAWRSGCAVSEPGRVVILAWHKQSLYQRLASFSISRSQWATVLFFFIGSTAKSKIYINSIQLLRLHINKETDISWVTQIWQRWKHQLLIPQLLQLLLFSPLYLYIKRRPAARWACIGFLKEGCLAPGRSH